MPGGSHSSSPPHTSHRHTKGRRGRLSLSFPLIMLTGLAVALLGTGIAVGTGAVQTPLSDSVGKAPKAATLVPDVAVAQPSASAYAYAIAKVPPSLLPHPKSPTAKPKPTPHPSTTPSMTPTETPTSAPATSSPLLTPMPTAEYQTPTGQNQLAWSEAILTALDDPLTSANIISIGYWMQNEAGSPPSGIVGANNPINVSEPGYGGTPIQYEAPGYSLMSYPTVQDGVEATAAYLNSGSYPQILSDLQQGAGLSDPSLASELEEYSGGGYSTIPDSWGASQGQPEG